MKATGQYAKLSITVDGTPVEIAELREWSVSAETEKIDSSVAGSQWASHEIGRASWEGEATVLDVDKFWIDYLFQKVTVDFYDKDTDATPSYRGTASVDFERSAPHDDLIESSLTFTGDGELTKPTV
jgi:hypothetical protein